MNEKRKSELQIAFVTTHYPPSSGFGGVCESAFGLSKALAEAGLCVNVITSDATKNSRIPFTAFAEMEHPTLHIYPFRYFYNERSCFSFEAKNLIKDLVLKSDLVYVNGIYTHPATLGARYARKRGKPHIVAIRNGLDPWMMKIKRAKKMLGFMLYVKADLKGATCIHATARQEVDVCLKMGIKGPFTIIPNGINSSEFTSLPKSERAENFWPVLKHRKVVLFLSRLSKQKGLDMLIPVWDHIMKKHPDAVLVIAGPDYLYYGNYIRSLAQDSIFCDTIFFTGNVTGERKLSLYSRADIFVLPSYSENFGNVVAEALVCGVPVITTQATPWSEVQKYDCGRWVPVGQNAIAEALDELLSMTHKKRSEMGQRGKNFILKHYTWDIAARKMIAVYRAILDGKGIPLYPEV